MITIKQTTISPWGPQTHWQKQVFRAFQNSINLGANRISTGMMLHREGATTEEALLHGPTR